MCVRVCVRVCVCVWFAERQTKVPRYAPTLSPWASEPGGGMWRPLRGADRQVFEMLRPLRPLRPLYLSLFVLWDLAAECESGKRAP